MCEQTCKPSNRLVQPKRIGRRRLDRPLQVAKPRHTRYVTRLFIGGVVATAMTVLAASCTSGSEPNQSGSATVFSSVLPVSNGPISALWLMPYPEGPPGYFCPHPERMIGVTTCRALSRSALTASLGEPVAWPESTPSHDCETGWTMKVIFRDRT